MTVEGGRETAIERREVLSGEVQPAKVAPPTDPEVLRREIRETRDDLAAALSSLARKTDVKTQVGQQLSVAKARLAETRARATEEVKARKTAVGASAAGLAALIAAGVVAMVAIRRKRAAEEAPVGRLRVRAQEAASRAYEAQARLRDAETRASKASRDKARKAQAKARKSPGLRAKKSQTKVKRWIAGIH
jgi:hypothetical protein